TVFLVDTNGNYNYETSTGLTPNQTSWTCPVTLSNGTNDFSVDYSSNATAQIVASTPLNNTSQPISAWVSTATLESSLDAQFVVGTSVMGNPSGGHLIVARYNFEQTNAPGVDSSGHGNDSDCGGGDGTTNYPDLFSTDAAVGSYSRDFQGHSFICFTPPAG